VDLEGDGERAEQRAEQRMRSSKLVEHCVRGCGLNPDWDKVRVLETESGWTSRRLRETYQTMRKQHEGKDIINDTDVRIDESWGETLHNFWDKDLRRTRFQP
jgi:hypothetical protein